MTLSKTALSALFALFFAAGASAQTASTAAAGPELNGYKQAAWGMSPDEVKTALNADFAHSEPSASLAELPWEVMRLAGIPETVADELLGTDLQWFYGGTQDVVFGFYKNRFFFYLSGLDKILPAADYEKKIAAKYGARTNTLTFQNTDPADNTVIGSYELGLWERKKTTIVLGVEKLFPNNEPETNYDVAYFSTAIFGEFKKDFTAALARTTEAEKKQSDLAVKEQQKKALEVIQ